jgi:hypothetical protein
MAGGETAVSGAGGNRSDGIHGNLSRVSDIFITEKNIERKTNMWGDAIG